MITPYSVIARPAAGTDHRLQTIAANLDTLFVATSCNDDFNLSRLERYLSVALDAHVQPVIVLTKADLCDDVTPFVDEARSLANKVAVAVVNATDLTAAAALAPWLQPGQTVAIVGSSGSANRRL